MFSPKKKTIALVAHDNRKKELLSWTKENKHILEQHHLCGTGTTSGVLSREAGLTIQAYKSGPLGGDLEIGAAIADSRIDMLIFFWDPLTAQPHDPDIRALLRISVLYDIPVAMNTTAANYLIHSDYMDKEYPRQDMQADL
ncbi:methylglyoxal synthase [Alkalibacter rhizosphaerae]|uniref:Methylglyoxal synthase n=1 Tax=Alkalibacter rhizosphaerae TaxID=2815577 RepID=A0A974XHV9_9FIRM|nr:methylglyoxal synthase [Alkalibacter rhizosphaerae]QSX08658.1 methylglyoxal synthase [Alkalibacter rhizosphaerae]